jgi:phage/plasmid-like protein (TIGR03299 family)
MSHELSIRNGVAEMAYTGETPWHGLGQQLAVGAPIEEWIVAAGMNWNIDAATVEFEAAGHRHVMSDRVVLHRSDTFAPLATVSTSYNVVQPGHVLEFFRELTDAAGFTLETAGVLFGGKRFWALASIGAEAAILDPADKMRRFLMITTACDGSMSTQAGYYDIRTVCNNTLQANLNRTKAKVTVSHRTTFDPKAVQRDLGIEAARSEFEDAMRDFRRMSETRVDPVDVIKATAELFAPGFADKERAEQAKLLEKTTGPIHRVGELALDRKGLIGSDLGGTQGTAWGWLNAVTQYIDHEARANSVDTRLNSAWHGRGNQIKQRAHEMAVEMIRADGSVHTVYIADNQDADADHAPGLLDDILAAAPSHV